MRDDPGVADVFGRAPDNESVQEDNAVLDDGNDGSHPVGSVFIEYRGAVDDVIDVPLPRRTHRIGQRNDLLVDAARLAVRIRLVVIAVEDLDLILVLQENAAVPPALALPGNAHRDAPFKMQLETAELFFRPDVAGRLVDREDAVVDDPPGISAPDGLPGIEILPVEKDDRVRRR